MAAIDSLAIFRIPESIATVYVTQAFVDRVAEHRLAGFEFRCVWPHAKVGNYKAVGEDSLDVMLRSSSRLKQTLVFRIGMMDTDAQTDPHHCVREKVDALEKLLCTVHQESQVSDAGDWFFADAEYEETEARIYFACTDVRNLLALVRPRIRDFVASAKSRDFWYTSNFSNWKVTLLPRRSE